MNEESNGVGWATGGVRVKRGGLYTRVTDGGVGLCEEVVQQHTLMEGGGRASNGWVRWTVEGGCVRLIKGVREGE